MPRKRRQRPPREVEASRIVVRDTKGRVRIILDAGGDDGFASVSLFAEDGRHSLWAGTQPGGAVVMSFGTPDFDGMVTLSAEGVALRARDGRLGVTVGRVYDGTDTVTVFRDGQPVWRAPATARSAETPTRARPRRRTGGKGHRGPTGA